MSTTISGPKLGTTDETVNVATINRALLGATTQVAGSNGAQGFDSIFLSGDARYSTVVSTRAYSDGPKAKNPEGPQDHFTFGYAFDVIETDDTSGAIVNQGRASVKISINWPQNVPHSSSVMRAGIENATALTYGGVSSNNPSSDVLDKIGNGAVNIFG